MKNAPEEGIDPFHSSNLDPREKIYKQIETYRSKLSEYQQLEKQFNEINIHISASEGSGSDAGKLAKGKGQLDRNARPPNTKRNSHKKVKIYELQKKMDKVSRENEEKRTMLESNMEMHNQMLWGIEDLSAKIEREKQASENLKQLSQQIESELEMNSLKIEQEANHLEESVREKELCTFQRKKLRDGLKRIRLMIHNLSNNLTQDLSFSQSDEQSGIIKSEGSIQVEIQNPSFPQRERVVTDLKLWLSKQNKRIDSLLNKREISQQRNDNFLEQFYALKKEMISNQILVKHHKLTNHLQTSKIKQYQHLVQLYKQNIAIRAAMVNDLTERISKYEGERGFLRGRIGVRIQEQRLARSLNALLQQDLERARQKLSYIKFLKKLIEQKV